MTTFTQKEIDLLCACMEYMQGDFSSSASLSFVPRQELNRHQSQLHRYLLQAKYKIISNIDFDKVAVKAGYKDAKNAKIMFFRLKKAKLSGGGDTTATTSSSTATSNGNATKATNKRKADGDANKPAAKRGRKPKAAKRVTAEQSENVDDEEEGVKNEVEEEGVKNEVKEVVAEEAEVVEEAELVEEAEGAGEETDEEA
ncbi:hypothetical protein MMC08_007051 [Hypocenomyce scalaris]|nr:hypothetical protein [Hypocenomyce scalaris]